MIYIQKNYQRNAFMLLLQCNKIFERLKKGSNMYRNVYDHNEIMFFFRELMLGIFKIKMYFSHKIKFTRITIS